MLERDDSVRYNHLVATTVVEQDPFVCGKSVTPELV